ncbi:hypothetical protein [Paraburkholderia phenoliruptrix]|uniref:hypothetical protein n=1 Tax=Paraburkholderia phenoliruptrix TaxID=252970 RepID=UPI002860CA5D|nr:hypothetical protein [Paraburkholderia phenoliruptrix]MDR6388411.1 hypothetical protein [Paraburkholderia phenoliruptrix]
MTDASLKKLIRQFAREKLIDHGFELSKPRLIQRHVEGLRQGMEFQPGNGHLAGKYTVNVFWSSTVSPISDTASMHAVKRMGDLTGEGNAWYDRDDESQFKEVEDLICTNVLPYLNRFSSIHRILQAVEDGLATCELAFPIDPGWREFHLGYCYLYVGDVARARARLERVIHVHSGASNEWVRERRNVVLSTLHDIANAK